MPKDIKPIIWLVDEVKAELKIHSEVLRVALPDFAIQTIHEPRTKQEVLPALEERRTVCFLLDQRMKSAGGCEHNGIDIAEYINQVNPDIPVFILTGFGDFWDEFEAGARYVEGILDKDDLQLDTTRLKRISSQILRRIDLYLRKRSQQGERLDDLLAKSLERELDKNELAELRQLEVAQDRAGLIREMELASRIGKVLEEHDRVMKKAGQK